MCSHQPKDYACPFCAIVAGKEGTGHWTKRSDVICQDADLTAFLSAHWWDYNEPGRQCSQHMEHLAVDISNEPDQHRSNSVPQRWYPTPYSRQGNRVAVSRLDPGFSEYNLRAIAEERTVEAVPRWG